VRGPFFYQSGNRVPAPRMEAASHNPVPLQKGSTEGLSPANPAAAPSGVPPG
jgi:hypothetical protein